jgi:hypothetical protein
MILSGALTLVDARFRAILKREKEKIEYKIEDKFTVFEPLYYKLQLSIGGSNYLIKILVDNGEYIHVKMFIPTLYPVIPCVIIFVFRGMTLEDKL